MATIRSQLQLTDGMSAVLGKINGAMTNLLSNFEAMQAASGSTVNLTNLQETRAALVGANQITEEMTRNLQETGNSQERFNRALHSGAGTADGLMSKIRNIAASVAAMAGIKQVLGLSDDLTSATARLNLIVDDGGSVQELQNKIFASAQSSRAAYMDTMQTVSKLGLLAGESFTGNDEMIKFAELMNKNFIVAGASAQEQSSAMYQLTQAMASGKLQGDEYRSIIENAPLLAKSIETYMQNAGVEGTMKEWASEGLLTAEVIKGALFASADDVEARFEAMPMTWAQVWTSMKNQAIRAFEPILAKINEVANTPEFENMVSGVVNAFYVLAAVAGWVFELMVNIGSGIYENWSWLEPIVWGLVIALGAYAAIALITNIANGLLAISEARKAAAQAMATGATFMATAAQYGLNAALYACPLTWIIMLVIALIAAFYAVIAAVNHFAGTSLSATGMICGAFMAAFAFIGNILIAAWNLVVDVFVLIYNLVAEVANFIGNVFTDPIGSICRLFFGLADTVLGILQALASAIDTIFGSNLAGSVQGWRDSLGGWVDDTFGKGQEVMAKMNADDMKLGRFEYGAAFDMGNTFGKGLESSVGDLFNFDAATGMPDGFDPATIAGNTDAIAGNTGATADALKTSEEDLKYLRDAAEQEAVNRFTTAEVKIDMTGMTNRIDSNMDLDGVLGALTTGFAEALGVAAEGVHV